MAVKSSVADDAADDADADASGVPSVAAGDI
jgi:hypothetical protein